MSDLPVLDNFYCSGCRKSFATRRALTNHQNSCKNSKKRLIEDVGDLRRVMAESEPELKKQRRAAFDLLRASVSLASSSAVEQHQPTVESSILQTQVSIVIFKSILY